jgi:hypothetical protein
VIVSELTAQSFIIGKLQIFRISKERRRAAGVQEDNDIIFTDSVLTDVIFKSTFDL